MLELKNIKKDYPAGDGEVHALKGIDLKFRVSEFVSVLGPSGCGKTTMLNIIGGLDKYTEGDLIIGGRSTKDFKDRDWDAYRNHSIGFVFQSYNLIPHQSVLQNVELALTLSGVSKRERRERAKKALSEVGLGDQLNKKPSEMSGGQMQRVAIARALVNDPDIILADEPTGALDTETSIQVMEILKEISKQRLIIMVTHNPELAEKYSTRIIRMLDGVITDDTMPLSDKEYSDLKEVYKGKNESQNKSKKPSMSLFTSFGLSLKNLFSKKGRTALTSFAGSIGIIGIALIYAVSQGMTTYINVLQEDTLSSYPLTIEETHTDLTSLMESFMSSASSSHEHEKDAVYTKSMIYDMINALSSTESTENDLESFKKFIETERGKTDGELGLDQAISGVQYTYNTDLLVYTENVDGSIIRSDSTELMKELIAEHMGMDMEGFINVGEQSGISSMMTMGTGGVNLWQEMLSGDSRPISDLIKKQYDVVYGSWPEKYNEIVLVLDKNNELDDITLYALGLKSKEDIDKIMEAAVDKESIETDKESWSYEEICDMKFRTILNSDCYKKDKETGLYYDLRDTEAGLKYLYDNGIDLKVTGIIRPNEDAVSAMLTGSIGYTHELTEYIIENSKNSDAIKAQLDKPSTDIFTGLHFKENSGNLTDAEKKAEFEKFISELDAQGKADAYVKIMSIPSADDIDAAVKQSVGAMDREAMEQAMITALTAEMGMDQKEIEDYISSMSDEEITELFTKSVAEQYKAQYAAGVSSKLAAMPESAKAAALEAAVKTYTDEQFATYYEEVLTFSESTLDDNLEALGYVELEKPATVNLYASTFESKEVIEDAIAKYNEDADELSEIKYTDYVGIMMSSVTTIINAITYVLIAFVAISLIVSSIMIGVITLISVQERTKEIGILRAIGASKRNVSSMFNAETVIIGFISGALGVGITYLICIPINIILKALTGIANLKAVLPIEIALILIGISVLLTMFAGIIPSRSAAKKDPVVALRTE